MLMEAIHTHDEELLKLALHDKIHQPYRTKLVPGLNDIMERLKHEQNVLGCVLSGAGPSILVVTKGNNTEEIRYLIRDTWANLNVKTDIELLKVEEQGAIIL